MIIKVFIDELLKKAEIENKYELVKLAIKRIKQLAKEKDKSALFISREKLPSFVLREIMEGKLKGKNLKEKE